MNVFVFVFVSVIFFYHFIFLLLPHPRHLFPLRTRNITSRHQNIWAHLSRGFGLEGRHEGEKEREREVMPRKRVKTWSMETRGNQCLRQAPSPTQCSFLLLAPPHPDLHYLLTYVCIYTHTYITQAFTSSVAFSTFTTLFIYVYFFNGKRNKNSCLIFHWGVI